ncbi:MAG: S41 family peptidase [Pseudomonadota bacterium]
MKMIRQRLAPLVLALCAIGFAALPARAAPSAAAVTAAERAEVIDTIATDLVGNYVFPDLAEKMAAAIRDQQHLGRYNELTDGNAFAALLTEQLREVSHDKHVQIRFVASLDPAERPRDTKQREQAYAFARSANFGFEKFERLDQNIAYLELRGFIDPTGAENTVAAAMGMVANADALIIDLRRNGGGSPAMVALLSSYLFDDERVHLSDLYWRSGNRTEQFWTNPKVAGQRFGSKKPVYILTSKETFSAAEEFAYNLKYLKRAVIVGDTTGGGANPGGRFTFGKNFGGFIPTGRAINPVTQTNWEGAGVQPDVAVPADRALITAQWLATKALSASISDPLRKEETRKSVAALQTQLDGMKKP